MCWSSESGWSGRGLLCGEGCVMVAVDSFMIIPLSVRDVGWGCPLRTMYVCHVVNNLPSFRILFYPTGRMEYDR